MVVVLGLFAAVLYGVGDFAGGIGSRRVSAVTLLLWSYPLGAVLMTLLLFAFPGHLSWHVAFFGVLSLTGAVANLDTYKPLADVSVTFALNKAVLTADDKAQLDQLAATTNTARGYILELTGGTDSSGSAEYNYALSQRRADTVANYLQAKYNIPPRKFYMVGIGKDQQVDTDKTAAGRQKNRRVQIRVLSNMGAGQTPTAQGTTPSGN